MSTAGASEPREWMLPEALQEFAADGDFDLVREIIDLFVADTESRLMSLAEAVRSFDLTLVKRISHGIKGAAAQMGLQSLARKVFDLEQNSRTLEPGALGALSLDLCACWEQTRPSVMSTRNLLPG